MSIRDEIEVYSQGQVHPFERGGSIDTRVIAEHPRKGCGWSMAFQARPDTIVPLSRLLAEIDEHATRCPFRTETDVPPWIATADAAEGEGDLRDAARHALARGARSLVERRGTGMGRGA